MTNARPRLFLVDGMAIAYRAFFTFINNPLRNSKGENTSAIFGFANAILKIMNDEKPDHLAVAFDTPEPTFRHRKYESYKATREKMPEELGPQLPRLKELTEAMGIRILEVPGYEADDIIGTLAVRSARDGMDVFMVTADKDFMQLVSPHVFIYNPIRKDGNPEILDEASVVEKFGVGPAQVPDILGLMGDSSDNIPGVTGVGEKTAAKLISEFGSIRALYENTEKLKGKLKQNVEADRKNAFLSRELAVIDTDVPLDVRPDTLTLRPHIDDRLVALLTEYGFHSLISRLQKTISNKPQRRDTQFRILPTPEDMRTAWDSSSGSVSCTLVSDSVEPMRAQLRGVAWTRGDGSGFFVPFTGPAESMMPNLAPLFIGEHQKIFFNAKQSAILLGECGARIEGPLFDVSIAGHLLSSDRNPTLQNLAEEYLSESVPTTTSEIENGKLSYDDSNPSITAEAVVAETHALHRLHPILTRRLEEIHSTDVYQGIEIPLIPVLATMERTGVWLDAPILSEMSREFSRKIAELESRIHQEAGLSFNVNSPSQLGDILFDKLQIHKIAGVEKPRKTKTGQYSTDVRVLEEYQSLPIVDSILHYRQLTKLKSTYVDGLPPLIHPRTGRIHSTFSQTVAATGRLSSSNPNFQNIPVRTDIGREIRKAFGPQKAGHVILTADYSQIELRVMAHMSGDPHLIGTFAAGQDIHTSTASLVFDVPADQVTRELRRKAKDINFGILYGISPFGLASRIGMSQSEAKEFIQNYFSKYPRVKEFIQTTLDQGKSNGYVTTLFGRRRFLPDLKSRNYAVRQNAERAAINTPIQGTAAELIKIAMIRIHEELSRRKLQSRMILQVHDELIFEADRSEVDELEEIVKVQMESAATLHVPLEVDLGVGDNWLEAK